MIPKLLAGLVLLFVATSGCVSAKASAAPPDGIPAAPDIASCSAEQVTSMFRVTIHTIPYLLGQYLQTGDPVLVRETRDAAAAVDLFIKALGKSVDNDVQKELFAKLLVGAQKLKTCIEKTAKAADECKIAEAAFQVKSKALTAWMDANADASLAPMEGTEGPIAVSNQAAFDEVRIETCKAILFNGVSPCGPLADQRRNKARQAWASAVKQAEAFAQKAVGPREKNTARLLAASVRAIRSLGEDLPIKTDDLNQVWEETLNVVDSLDALLRPTSGPRAGEEPSKPANEPSTKK
ncbi:MAG: hypothetical protein V2B18_18475 [Pseudomonadota bacterium]